MRELTCTQDTAQHGLISVVLRFHKREIFMKFGKGNPTVNQMISQMKSKGAKIVLGNGWYRINLFPNHTFVKLGVVEFNVQETPDDKLEEILFNFYYDNYLKAKFIVKETTNDGERN